MSCLEVLKYWGTRAKAAEALGLDMRIIIGDESSGFPVDDLLGFTHKSRQASREIIDSYLSETGLAHRVVVRPLIEGMSARLRCERRHETLDAAYDRILTTTHQAIRDDIRQARQSFNSQRVALFSQILTDRGRDLFGLRVRDEPELRELPADGLDYLVGAVAQFNSLLSMRTIVRRFVMHAESDEYPELWHPSRRTLHMGVTRSSRRPSLLVIGRQWKGRSVMPAYGLPVFDDAKRCRGLVHQPELVDSDALHVMHIDGKAVCAIVP